MYLNIIIKTKGEFSLNKVAVATKANQCFFVEYLN